MILFLLLIGLWLAHFLTGNAILKLVQFKAAPAVVLSVSMVIGVFVAALVPFFLQLVFIQLTPVTVLGTWALLLLLLWLPLWRRYKSSLFNFNIKFRYDLKIYEWPFLLLAGFMLLVVTWRCYYVPPLARDLMSGPETIATFALKEKTLINSVFALDLSTTNNQYKSPFLTTLQLIYKMAGFPYGAMWLSLLTISFVIFMYSELRRMVHPLIAGMLLLMFLSAPELYAYSYIVLYDYSNMIFFCLGTFFLGQYAREGQWNIFSLSVLLLAASVYIRSETLVLVLLLLPVLQVSGFRAGRGIRRMVLEIVVLCGALFVAYAIVAELYNNHYLPAAYHVGTLLNPEPYDLNGLWARTQDVWTKLVIGQRSELLYGYIFYTFFILCISGLIYTRRWSRVALFWLYCVLAVFAGLCLLGFLIPMMDVVNSTKRSMFKIFPLILFAIASSPVVQALSGLIDQWEYAPPKEAVPGKEGKS